MSESRAGASAAALVAAMFPCFALAQARPPTREEIDPSLRTAPEEPGRLRVEGGIERAPCALAEPEFGKVKLTITAATFNNLGPVDPEALRPAYSSYVGTEQPISVLCEIRDAAATILRGRGYLSAVQVPVQQIVDGAVRFEVLYARMSSIRVLGEPGPDAKMIERYLQPLANGEPFNRLSAERNLLLARSLPGYQIRLSLRPTGNSPGDMVGEVRVDHVPVMADISIQNLASPDTGRFGAQARIQFNGLFKQGDRTVLSAYSTAQIDEQQVYQFSHDLAIGSKGLRIGARATYAITRPDIPGAQVDGRTFYASLEATYPLKLSQAASLTGGAGIEIVQQTIRFGGNPFARDRLRIGYLRLDGEAMDLRGMGPGGTIGWRARGSLQLRQGMSIAGASQDCRGTNPACLAPGFVPLSIAAADPSPTLIKAQAEFELRPFRNATVLLAPRGQYSAQTLPAFEQFSTGNYSVGRGFDPGALSGDSGFGLQLEFRLDPRRVTKRSNVSYQPYVFADQALVWRNGVPGSKKLQSAGGGVRFFLPGRMRLDLTGAAPVSRLPFEASKRPARFLMTLTTNVLPWRNR